MNKYGAPLLIAIAMLLFACNTKSGQEQAQLTKAPVHTNYAYWHMLGDINGQAATLNLMKDSDYAGMSWYHGTLINENDGSLQELYGSPDSTGALVLRITSRKGNGEEEATLTGKLEEGVFSGEYFNPGDQKRAPFGFKRIPKEQAVIFTGHILEDTILANPDLKEGPRCRLRYKFLQAANFQFLNDEIRKGIGGDSLAQVYRSVDALYENERKSYFEHYRKEMAQWADEEFGATMNYETDHSVQVLVNTPDLLSLAFMTYNYSGGAHGNYGSSCVSYDLKKKRKITLQDIFKPGYEAELKKALNAAAKQALNTQNLNEILFEPEIEPNENFFLTPGGICFNFTPYEIAAYAYGEIKFYIPFSDLKNIMK
jgi:Protein of unknown function (DUF3298)/Deacetylase PdaC